MCGRYTFFTDKELREIDEIIEKVSNDINVKEMKTGEIFPTDLAPVLMPEKDKIAAHLINWGYPSFHGKGVIINARSETVREKPMFKTSLAVRRCVIPSTGFYEWDEGKKKFLFNLPNTGVLYMAGLYNEFEGENRFVILTTNSNKSVSDVHDRMPVVLVKSRMEDWLFNNKAVDEILFGEQPNLIKAPASA